MAELTIFDDDPPDADDEWTFDAADAEPAVETLGESIDAEEIAHLEEVRKLEQEQEEALRKEAAAEVDEAGRQQRQNVRVNVKFPITLNFPGRDNVRIRSRDVSATGFGFATRLPLELEDTGVVTIEFPDWRFTKPFTVRFMKAILAGHVIGAQFDELSDDERERVVKEVFAVQRRQLQDQRARAKQQAGGA
jgi:hypothetical protein